MPVLPFLRICLVFLGSLLVVLPPHVHADSLARQRSLFQTAEKAIARGDLATYERLRPRLTDYPLYPYLEYADLKGRLDTEHADEVKRFLDQHGEEYLGEMLRKSWLAAAAAEQRWQDLIAFYSTTLNTDPQYYCPYLWARHQTGDRDYAYLHVDKVWLTANSLPNACDPLLNAWRVSGKQSPQLIWDRFTLAMESGNRSLARVLALRLQGRDRLAAEKYLSLDDHPAQIRQLRRFAESGTHAGDIVSFGLRRLAKQSPDLAATLWESYKREMRFDSEQARQVYLAIGRPLSMRNDETTLHWYEQATRKHADPQLIEWQMRVALRRGDWQAVRDAIGRLPGELLETEPRWQYWKARSLEALGSQGAEEPEALYRAIARQRNFYGFLAADRLGLPYQMVDASNVYSDQLVRRAIDSRLALRRASEFMALKEESRARREWSYLLRYGNSADRLAAAQVAYQWGWFFDAIRAAARSDDKDNLALRFPLAYQKLYERASRQSGLPVHWMMALTRQESAFSPVAKSPVGATGLMQLMPATAREVAQRNGIGFSQDKLTQPDYNILLGSSYLKSVYQRFSDNRVLASAAYNAGPGRVRQWLGNMPADAVAADVWIESIPFTETRNYVQNVLTYSTIYAHRLGHQQPLLPPARPGGSGTALLSEIRG